MRKISSETARLIAVSVCAAAVVTAVPVLAHGVEHAVFSHNSDKVDGMHAKRFRKTLEVREPATTVLKIGSLRVSFFCNYTGFITPELTATTTVDNASIELGFTTGYVNSSSRSFVASDSSFNKGESFSLTQGATFGHGSVTYTTLGGKAVTLTFGSFESPDTANNCLVQGVALGR